MPKPLLGDFLLQAPAYLQGQAAEDRDGQVGARAAVGRRVFGTGAPTQGDQQDADAEHGRPARLGVIDHLRQPRPQRQGRGEHGVREGPEGHAFVGQGLGDVGGGQHLGKG